MLIKTFFINPSFPSFLSSTTYALSFFFIWFLVCSETAGHRFCFRTETAGYIILSISLHSLLHSCSLFLASLYCCKLEWTKNEITIETSQDKRLSRQMNSEYQNIKKTKKHTAVNFYRNFKRVLFVDVLLFFSP